MVFHLAGSHKSTGQDCNVGRGIKPGTLAVLQYKGHTLIPFSSSEFKGSCTHTLQKANVNSRVIQNTATLFSS